MSDLLGYGKIYDTTYWGVGRDNTIGWGIVYANLGDATPAQVNQFVADTEADGGSVGNVTAGTNDLRIFNDNP